MTDTHGWTPERRARQAALIHTWKPWATSTGPRTAAGKVKASQNATVGQQRKAQALAAARQELFTAVTKIHELTGKRGSLLEMLNMRFK